MGAGRCALGSVASVRRLASAGFSRSTVSVAGEAVTFLGLVVFFVVQFAVLSMWLSKSPVLFLLAVLGLLASLLALYGPMLMSLGSHVLVDAVMPSGAPLSHTPKYGAAEGFEQKGDYYARFHQDPYRPDWYPIVGGM